jgi:abortive infection bacteriophage resistance protein
VLLWHPPELFYKREPKTMKKRNAIRATDIEQQKAKLREHGVVINDEAFADNALMFIGYYHLGFYLYPFEKTYPYLDKRRRHEVQDGTTIEDAVAMHDFDNDLRCLLQKYLVQIEIAFRHAVIYHMCQKYPDNPCWYLDKTIVDDEVVDTLIVDYEKIKRNEAIKNHHKNHRKSKYAPAWKTLEFETLGTMQKLYEGILRVDDKLPINRLFGVADTFLFAHYINTMRFLRNACAHGHIIMDFKLPMSLRVGPAGRYSGSDKQRVICVIGVMRYFVKKISATSEKAMCKELKECFEDFFSTHPHLRSTVECLTKLKIKDFS